MLSPTNSRLCFIDTITVVHLSRHTRHAPVTNMMASLNYDRAILNSPTTDGAVVANFADDDDDDDAANEESADTTLQQLGLSIEDDDVSTTYCFQDMSSSSF